MDQARMSTSFGRPHARIIGDRRQAPSLKEWLLFIAIVVAGALDLCVCTSVICRMSGPVLAW